MKKIFQIARPFLRGVVKSFPLGNAVIEGVNNAKASTNNAEKADTISNPLPHDWVSIITQATVSGLIVYAFVTKAITIDQVIGFLK